jgi:hypothetical protein
VTSQPLAALALAIVGGLAAVSQSAPPGAQVTAGAGDHVVLELTVSDRAARDVAAVGALDVMVDGRVAQQMLLTPGIGRTKYDALIGPLSAGPHRIVLERSSLWPWPSGLDTATVATRVVGAGSSEAAILAPAPVLGIRADTIGTASDIPLVMYVEDDRRDGKGWLRYSVILSNEDGGTATPALMARWGRTTDIELIYETEMDGARVVRDRFQGPDHEIRAFAGLRIGNHPQLLIATLNNMFIDRGRSLAYVRPVPALVDLTGRTRESVMDDNPWIYPLMARELVAENRIGTQIEDPREFLYVEAGLTLEHAAVSVKAGSSAGGWKDSTRGRPELAVNRNGWVRIAVHAPMTSPSLQWECRAAGEVTAGATPRCAIEWKRVFRLGQDYLPGENVISPGRVTMGVGVSDAVPLKDSYRSAAR